MYRTSSTGRRRIFSFRFVVAMKANSSMTNRFLARDNRVEFRLPKKNMYSPLTASYERNNPDNSPDGQADRLTLLKIVKKWRSRMESTDNDETKGDLGQSYFTRWGTGNSWMVESSHPRARTLAPPIVKSAQVTSGKTDFPLVTWNALTAGGVGGKSRTKEMTSFKLAKLCSCPEKGGKERSSWQLGSVTSSETNVHTD